MSESHTSEESDFPEGAWIPIGAAIGLPIGVAIGMVLTGGINPVLIGVGLAFGTALGAVFEAAQNGSIDLNTE